MNIATRAAKASYPVAAPVLVRPALTEIFPQVYAFKPILKPEHLKRLIALKATSHHDEDGGHHIGKEKPHALAWVAERIWPAVAALQYGKMRAYAVDHNMRIYRLAPGKGEVTPHQDLDFAGPDGSRALWSVIVHLSDNYRGGETVFQRTRIAPHGAAGGGFIFPHALVHEGLNVESGVKYVLKTDIFMR